MMTGPGRVLGSSQSLVAAEVVAQTLKLSVALLVKSQKLVSCWVSGNRGWLRMSLRVTV
jgi:hypothetical protein